jgi:hypothetical protein
MVAAIMQFSTVADLMSNRQLGLAELVRSTGISPRIVKAIALQHYTPSPVQRDKISRALRFPRERIIWGHSILPEQFSQIRL